MSAAVFELQVKYHCLGYVRDTVSVCGAVLCMDNVNASIGMGALVSFAVGASSLAVASCVLYILRPDLIPALQPGLAYAFTLENSWLCTGGLFGALNVTANIVLSPLISVTGVAVNNLLGRLTLSICLDFLGAFGVPSVEVKALRLVGAALVFSGVVFTSWRSYARGSKGAAAGCSDSDPTAKSIYAKLDQEEEQQRARLLDKR